jgi:hypothetical protein
MSMPARKRPPSTPKTPEELKEGDRLLHEVLQAIPSETDDREDAVLREVVEGMASAADLAAGKDAAREQRSAE